MEYKIYTTPQETINEYRLTGRYLCKPRFFVPFRCIKVNTTTRFESFQHSQAQNTDSPYVIPVTSLNVSPEKFVENRGSNFLLITFATNLVVRRSNFRSFRQVHCLIKRGGILFTSDAFSDKKKSHLTSSLHIRIRNSGMRYSKK